MTARKFTSSSRSPSTGAPRVDASRWCVPRTSVTELGLVGKAPGGRECARPAPPRKPDGTGFSTFWCGFLPAFSARSSRKPSSAAVVSLVIELVQLQVRLGAYKHHTSRRALSSHAYDYPKRRDVVRRRAELNDVRVEAARSFHAIEQTVTTSRRTRATDAIERAGAAAAPARSRASSRRSTA